MISSDKCPYFPAFFLLFPHSPDSMAEHDPEQPSPELSDAVKNWLAMDGLWFLAVEEMFGMDAALQCDNRVWEQFAPSEARKIMKRCGIAGHGGLDALENALKNRMYRFINPQSITRPDDHTLILSVLTCHVQSARRRKNLLPFHCKEIGMTEYSLFARTIDPRIMTECITTPPESAGKDCACSWKFTMETS
jgi:hypothetical protein